ncbi:hypothetical protein THTE_2210 [Thermogutta terrifontis]|uniref:Uncharacterized protein n=1 Tax=Thermogutta terrifontis TaxID=1331910 RepID=A0A286RFU7_9BACT|nr:hypothetical protein THTE_2210 [Thermogutta terrifontis]
MDQSYHFKQKTLVTFFGCQGWGCLRLGFEPFMDLHRPRNQAG